MRAEISEEEWVTAREEGREAGLEQRLGVLGAHLEVRPLPGGAQVADRGVEPHVPDLAGDLGEVVGVDRDPPLEVTGDAPVLESLVEPLVGDRAGELRPVVLGVDPGPDAFGQPRLQQEHVGRRADLELRRARHRAARLDQVGGLQGLAAVLALVATGPFVATVGAGADHVAVGQEAGVRDRVHLLGAANLGVALRLEPTGEVVGEPAVGRA